MSRFCNSSTYVDSDNDSIQDKIDLCPNEPEVYNGYLDTDGCPDVSLDSSFDDKDGDGIADQFDICPNEPETYNRFSDYDGCPDSIHHLLVH